MNTLNRMMLTVGIVIATSSMSYADNVQQSTSQAQSGEDIRYPDNTVGANSNLTETNGPRSRQEVRNEAIAEAHRSRPDPTYLGGN